MFGRNSWVPLILTRSSAPDQMAPFEAGDSCDWTSLSRLLSFPAGINDASTWVWCKKEPCNLPPALKNIPVEMAPPTNIHRFFPPAASYMTNSYSAKLNELSSGDMGMLTADEIKKPLCTLNLWQGFKIEPAIFVNVSSSTFFIRASLINIHIVPN